MMPTVDITVNDKTFSVQVEEPPTLIIASSEGVPVKSFWSDLVVVLTESQLKELRHPRSDFLKSFVLGYKGERWAVSGSVVYNVNSAPVGNLLVCLVRPELIEYLGQTLS